MHPNKVNAFLLTNHEKKRDCYANPSSPYLCDEVRSKENDVRNAFLMKLMHRYLAS